MSWPTGDQRRGAKNFRTFRRGSERRTRRGISATPVTRKRDQAVANSIPEFGAAFDTGEPQRFMTEFLNRKR
jgi:hypothetical protein